MSALEKLVGNREAVAQLLAENATIRAENAALREELLKTAQVMELHAKKIRSGLATQKIRTATGARPAA